MDDIAPPRTNGVLLSARRGAHCATWRAHAALLALVGGYIGVSAFQSTPDANIGLGLGLLALGVMGAPWSVPLFMSDRVTVGSGLFVVVTTGGAIFNLVVHAMALGWRSARTARRHKARLPRQDPRAS